MSRVHPSAVLRLANPGPAGAEKKHPSAHRGIRLLRGRHRCCGKRLLGCCCQLSLRPGLCSGPYLQKEEEGGRGGTGAAGGAPSLAVPHRPPPRLRPPAPAPRGLRRGVPFAAPAPGGGGPPGLTPPPPFPPHTPPPPSPRRERFPGAAGPDGGPPRSPTPVRRGPGPAVGAQQARRPASGGANAPFPGDPSSPFPPSGPKMVEPSPLLLPASLPEPARRPGSPPR